jgi:hypothetical protein
LGGLRAEIENGNAFSHGNMSIHLRYSAPDGKPHDR